MLAAVNILYSQSAEWSQYTSGWQQCYYVGWCRHGVQASAADTSLALALLSRDPVAPRHTYTSITPATLRIHRIQVTQLVIGQPAVTVVTARTAPAGAARPGRGGGGALKAF